MRAYGGSNKPRATLFGNVKKSQLETWLAGLAKREKRPNKKQIEYIQRIIDRVMLEAKEEDADKINSAKAEPLLDFITGEPGTGKTEVLKWIREMFETQLGWTHGNEFVFLAQQNTMGDMIGGFTIHHRGDIPLNEEDAGRKRAQAAAAQDINKLFIRCQNLRVLAIDEISLVSAELLCYLEEQVRRAIRLRRSYKVIKYGPLKERHRVFGGVNLLCFGDWWQLPPVNATAIFSNPFKAKSAVAQSGLKMFW